MPTPWLTGMLLLLAAQDDPFLQNVRTADPQSAPQQAQQFHVPPGFEVQLVAAEPDIPKPMNLAFDAQGRLWVSGSVEYPYAAAEGKGRDSVKVLADTDGDGRADRITTFVEELNIPMGLYPYRDGVVVYSIDRLDFWRDTDGDGRADARETLFGPLGRPVDTHGMQNAFRRGLDGWLYINHGFSNETAIRGRDGSQITLNSGNTYRVRLDGSRVEQFTWGQVNPFGSAWTELGDLITADCHSKPLTLLLRGGYYSSFGKPHDGLGFAPELMSHHHGSTGLAGVAYYAGGSWPEEYYRSLFVGNVVTSRVHRDVLKFDGATAKADEQADFVTCDDPWFRPVDLRFGPDGALYIADFYNRIIGHYEVPLDHRGRDRHRGRIWRVVYRGTPAVGAGPDHAKTNLATASVVELIAAFNDPVLTRRMLALDQVTDRFGTEAVAALRQAADVPEISARDWPRRVLARWALFRLGQLSESDIASLAAEHSSPARNHAMRMLAELPRLSSNGRSLAIAGLNDVDANVRRAAADALGQHPHVSLVAPLMEALASVDSHDAALRHALRLALRNQLRDEIILADALHRTWPQPQYDELVGVVQAVQSPTAGQFVLDYLERKPVAPDQLAGMLRHAARNLGGERAEQLLQIIRQHAKHDLNLHATLFQTVVANLKGSPGDNSAIAGWGRELVSQLIDQAQTSDGDWSVVSGGNPWGHEKRRAEDGHEHTYLSSLPGGERQVSQLRSRKFAAPARLSFYLCGHRGDPNTVEQPAGDAPQQDRNVVPADNCVQVRLVESGQIVRRAFPPRRDTAQRIDWDLSPWAGETIVLELIDNLDAPAYAWLAVARFEPNLVSVPRMDPREVARFQQLAATLLTAPVDDRQRSTLEAWVRDGIDWPSRSAAAVALARVDDQPVWQVVATLVGAESLPTVLRRDIVDQFATADDERLVELLTRIFQYLTQPQQEFLAHQLASSDRGAEQLLTLVEHGRVNGRLLQRPAIREQLSAAGLDSLDERIQAIVVTLPPEDEHVATALTEALEQFRSSPGAMAEGKQVFVKHCSSCHQVEGEGNLVGPQLDGIGNRGIERIVEDLLAPYRNVDGAFRTTILSLDDGRVLSGLVRQQTPDRWLLVNSEGKEIVVPADSIEEQHRSTLSIMPDNFRQVLTPSECNALLAFLSELRATNGRDGSRLTP